MIDDKTRNRLNQEEVIWMTTVRRDGQPQSSVVWFLIEGNEILIYSKKGTIRNDNIVANPKVSLNLNSTPLGGSVVTLEGTARLDPEAPRASENPPYLGKYLERITSYKWTPESFSNDYPTPIRIEIDRVRSS
jgi:PPOX class probable F420-dependent enzyme